MILFLRRSMQLTKEQRIFIVRSFDTINNVTGLVRAYQEHFQGKSVSRVTVRRTIAKFCSHGIILNRNKGNSGRLVTKRTHWTWTCSGMATSPPRSNTLRFFFVGLFEKTKSMKHPQLIRKIHVIVSDAMLMNLVIILK